MIKVARGRRLQRGEWVVLVANALVVISASVITALLALVVEDFLPRSNTDGYVVPLRWAVGIGALAVLLVALLWRARAKRKRGTLFYVQLLDESMPNLHEQSLAAAQNRRMSMYSVVRWVDLGRCTRDGVIDVVEPCREVGAALEEAINNDRDDTGYTVAPNMLWPMALSIGAYLPRPEDLRLLELQPNGKESEFSLLTDRRPCTTSVQEDFADGEVEGRIGVWLAFTESAKHLSSKDFRKFGVRTLHMINCQDKVPGDQLTEEELSLMGSEIADHLERIKKSAGERELVVIAMAPKTVMLSAGWHLAQRTCRFFRNTHLMHYDENSKTYIPMRVREAQPATPPVA